MALSTVSLLQYRLCGKAEPKTMAVQNRRRWSFCRRAMIHRQQLLGGGSRLVSPPSVPLPSVQQALSCSEPPVPRPVPPRPWHRLRSQHNPLSPAFPRVPARLQMPGASDCCNTCDSSSPGETARGRPLPCKAEPKSQAPSRASGRDAAWAVPCQGTSPPPCLAPRTWAQQG